MATVIQIKRSSGTTAPSTLKLGELAYTYGAGTQGNLGDRLFIGEGGVDGNGDANNISVIGGQYFTDMLDHVAGTLTGSSALIADANLAIDQIIVGNSATVGGTVKLNEGTNNGSAFIGLKAPDAVTTTTTFTLPDGDGTAGQFLKTDGSGNLDFATVNQFIDLAGDTGTDTYNTAETLTFTGGQSITTAVTDNQITFSVTALSIDTGQLTDDAVTNAKLSTNGELTLGSSNLQLGGTTTDISGLTSLVVDDITINGQSITTTASNIDIYLTPHGTGTVVVPAGYEARAGFTAQSLVNKSYVDAIAEGLHVHASARLATTVELTNEDSSPPTYDNGTSGVGATLTFVDTITNIDGVSVQNGDRILIKNQTALATNGIYIRTSGTVYTRAIDFDTAGEIQGGDFLFVTEGTLNANNGYVQTEVSITIGTTDIIFEQFSGAGQITAGAALSKTGNQLDVEVDNSSIEIVADALQVKALGITNAMLAGSIDGAKIENFVFTDESSTQGAVQIGNAMEFLAGEGINTIASGNTLQIVGELASTSNIGVASFTSDNFAVTSGDVAITTVDGGSF
jgi:hypothetical protein